MHQIRQLPRLSSDVILPIMCWAQLLFALSSAERGRVIKRSIVLYTTSLTEGPEKIPCYIDVVNSPRYMREPSYPSCVAIENFSGFQSQEEV